MLQMCILLLHFVITFIVLTAYHMIVNDLEQTGHKTSYNMRQNSRIFKRKIR